MQRASHIAQVILPFRFCGCFFSSSVRALIASGILFRFFAARCSLVWRSPVTFVHSVAPAAAPPALPGDPVELLLLLLEPLEAPATTAAAAAPALAPPTGALLRLWVLIPRAVKSSHVSCGISCRDSAAPMKPLCSRHSLSLEAAGEAKAGVLAAAAAASFFALRRIDLDILEPLELLLVELLLLLVAAAAAAATGAAEPPSLPGISAAAEPEPEPESESESESSGRTRLQQLSQEHHDDG